MNERPTPETDRIASGELYSDVVRAEDYLRLHKHAHRLERQRDELVQAVMPISRAYPNDPGTSDLDNEQPVTITLGDVRRVWAALAKVKVGK